MSKTRPLGTFGGVIAMKLCPSCGHSFPFIEHGVYFVAIRLSDGNYSDREAYIKHPVGSVTYKVGE
jgi:hypothetical protein